MNEETVQTEPVVDEQTAAMEDYVLYDDDGNQLDESGKPMVEQGQPEPTVQPPQTPQAPQQTTQQQQKQEVPEKTKQEVPDGFEKMFYKEQDGGQHQFSAEAALDFLRPQKETNTAFRYEPTPLKDAPPPTEPADGKDEWEKAYEEKQSFVSGLKDNMFMWKKHYYEAVQSGYQPEQALQYAESKVSEMVDREVMKYTHNFDKEQAKKQYDSQQSSLANLKYKQNARNNESMFINELGGEDNYTEFMFGKKAGDKFVPGAGTEIIRKIYEIANPDFHSMNKAEADKHIAEWWNKTVGDERTGLNNLQFFYNLAKYAITNKYLPKFVETSRNMQNSQNARNQTGLEKRTSGLTPSAPAPKGGPTTVERWLGAPVDQI